MGLNCFPKSICVSEASPTACDFHSRPTGFPKRSFQNQFQTECKVCLAGLPCSHPFLFRRTRRTLKTLNHTTSQRLVVDVEQRNTWPTCYKPMRKPKSIQKSGGGNASGSEIMVAKLSRWEAIADSPQILDLDLLGWVWTASPKAFASVKHLKQHVTFTPDPLDSPKDHSKTSSKQNAKSAWLVFHARILSCFRRTRRTPKL